MSVLPAHGARYWLSEDTSGGRAHYLAARMAWYQGSCAPRGVVRPLLQPQKCASWHCIREAGVTHSPAAGAIRILRRLREQPPAIWRAHCFASAVPPTSSNEERA